VLQKCAPVRMSVMLYKRLYDHFECEPAL